MTTPYSWRPYAVFIHSYIQTDSSISSPQPHIKKYDVQRLIKCKKKCCTDRASHVRQRPQRKGGSWRVGPLSRR